MSLTRKILAAVVVTIVNAGYGMLTCGWLFSWIYKLQPAYVWIPEGAMNTKFLILLNLGNLAFTFIFVVIFTNLYDSIYGKCGFCKGLAFGVMVWLVGMLPGMFATYMFMTINQAVPVYWAISGLVSLLISGGLTGLICKKESTCSAC